MPDGFSTRLSEDNPGVLGHSLVDELPVELTNVEHIIIDDPDENSSVFSFQRKRIYAKRL